MQLGRCAPLRAAPVARRCPLLRGLSRHAVVRHKNVVGALINGSASDKPKAEHAPVATAEAPPSRPRLTKDQRLVSMRMVRQNHIKGARIGITVELAERLAGYPVFPGEVFSVPIHLPSSSPQSYLPASCNVAVRALSGGAFECHIKGLGKFLRGNGAVVDSSVLLLVTNPPDPVNGNDTPSLTVRLANQEGADNDFMFKAMYDYAVEYGAWISTQAEYHAYFSAQAQRLEALASGAPVPPAVAPAPLRAPAKSSPLVAWAPTAGDKGQVEERLRLLPEGLPKVGRSREGGRACGGSGGWRQPGRRNANGCAPVCAPASSDCAMRFDKIPSNTGTAFISGGLNCFLIASSLRYRIGMRPTA